MRFYPDTVPRFELEPLADKFAIQFFDDRQGEGVISLKEVLPNEELFVFTGFLISDITQYSLQIKHGLHIHDPYFMGKILHSCDPNSICDMDKRLFIAIKKIAPMEAVTMDYASTEHKLYKNFHCNCHSSNCRGFIKGRVK